MKLKVTATDLARHMATATDEQLSYVTKYGRPYAARAAQREVLKRQSTYVLSRRQNA